MFGLRRLGPTYWIELVSHRLLRYWSGPLHILLLVTSALLATHGDRVCGGAGAPAGGAGAGRASRCSPAAASASLRVLHYYLLVTLATVIALAGYLRHGVPATWDKAAGTRTT